MLAIELGDVDKCRNFVEQAYKKGLITFFFLFTNEQFDFPSTCY